MNKNIFEELYNNLLFHDMDKTKVNSLIARLNGKKKTYQKNEIVISEEDVVNDIGILLSGELCKVRYCTDGTEQMVRKLKPSFMVGLEVAVSQKKTSPYCIYAEHPSSIYWFSVKCLEEPGILAEKDRLSLYQKCVYFLANETIRQYRKVEILSARSARERIEKYLKVQMIKHKSNEFEIEFNRQQLANYLGLNRSVLSHELKKMEKDGILKVHKNHFIL